MDSNPPADSYETENIVAIDRMTALCQFIVYTFQVTVNHQYIILLIGKFLVWILVFKVLCTLCLSGATVMVANFYIAFNNRVGIQFFISNVFIEV